MANNIARLIVRNVQKQPAAEILLVDDVTTLGRAATCQVVIENNFASRRHAQIIHRSENYWLKDLDSKNGTLLNGEPVSGEAVLHNGAEIRIGDAIFGFIDPQATHTQPALAGGSAPLWIDSQTREVWLDGEMVVPSLSLKQFDLLFYLYQRAGDAVSKDELALAVWPETDSETIYDYQIDKMVSRVRERIGKEWIETVWGYGYRLRLFQ